MPMQIFKIMNVHCCNLLSRFWHKPANEHISTVRIVLEAFNLQPHKEIEYVSAYNSMHAQ